MRRAVSGLVLSSVLFWTTTAWAQTSVPKYGIFEVALTASGSYTNPYLQIPGDDNTPGFVVATGSGCWSTIPSCSGGGPGWPIENTST